MMLEEQLNEPNGWIAAGEQIEMVGTDSQPEYEITTVFTKQNGDPVEISVYKLADGRFELSDDGMTAFELQFKNKIVGENSDLNRQIDQILTGTKVALNSDYELYCYAGDKINEIIMAKSELLRVMLAVGSLGPI
ncbi:DUF1828 domain-containing protein [Lacticaseibacillus sharpeae]|uniref:DUF1828 domain-containing protein n=1 Tax=Lacticaseibacillus sharpeae JCM 1186 = DSM 20505 TaxID=1291052 RepID=A0A0R1ZLB0_9LACO|nr:DUF1828 domain-containing protein [Lacticaseibacillus sharpeae]KRM55311.1 hypothetical protein FC18_GL001477 [Lacticaseibacillus sharpeae JCM 1186 = DSM 20505]